MLTIQKFGGTSVANGECIRRAASIAAECYDRGEQVVVVLSAQGDTTDDLLEKARELSQLPNGREMDVLLTTGEQITIALMAMCLEQMGYPVVSLTGWQVKLETTADHGNARIVHVDTEKILSYLEGGYIVVVAGFQGVTAYGDITTLGRGGSDTTAVALAAALHADRCQIFTDVDGVYTKDPRKFADARKLETITYDAMLDMARKGAQVLHDRCVELAKEHGVVIEVLSSFERRAGTLVKD